MKEIVLKNKVFEKYIDQDEIFEIVKNIAERINKSKILNPYFLLSVINSLTPPFLLFPYLKLLLTKINFGSIFFTIIFLMNFSDVILENFKLNLLLIIKSTPTFCNKINFCK